jgi:hypothetical protein
MEPLLMILIPGLAGGLVLALLIARIGRATSGIVVPRRLAEPSPTLINMAHIQVEGVGGLGLVAASLAVAAHDPRIRLAVLLAGVLGIALALALIVMRRRLSFGSDDRGGPSMLGLDEDRRRRPAARRAVGPVPNANAWTSA